MNEPAIPSGDFARRKQPVLEVHDLVLRPWDLTDVPVLVQAYQDPAIMQWHGKTMTIDDAQEWVLHWTARWQDESGAGWAITRGGEAIGQFSLRRIDLDNGSGELSYWILPEGRGANVAPKALNELSAWAFGSAGFHRLELAHSVNNPASCRVAQKSGYPEEGVKRQQLHHADGWHDRHTHARLASDPGPIS
ncbi:GNAT family N-acetyltransferase [Arthrobacter psychrolactophilus]|uniref:GNAT family N-acetyltransferase n=1 Tax=Arthrobacter psychrolactophilus TaxID=92442 RepID=UPI001FE50D45|nr:GNAT family N-acetyltransferase [Arthrobacter psychrolactophilus]